MSRANVMTGVIWGGNKGRDECEGKNEQRISRFYVICFLFVLLSGIFETKISPRTSVNFFFFFFESRDSCSRNTVFPFDVARTEDRGLHFFLFSHYLPCAADRRDNATWLWLEIIVGNFELLWRVKSGVFETDRHTYVRTNERTIALLGCSTRERKPRVQCAGSSIEIKKKEKKSLRTHARGTYFRNNNNNINNNVCTLTWVTITKVFFFFIDGASAGRCRGFDRDRIVRNRDAMYG